MVVIAYVGVVSALVGAVVGWQFLGELSDANKQGLVLAEEIADGRRRVAGRRRRHRRGRRRRRSPRSVRRSRPSATASTPRRRSPRRRPNWRRRCPTRSTGSTTASARSSRSPTRSTPRCRSSSAFRWRPTTTPPSPLSERSAICVPTSRHWRTTSGPCPTTSTRSRRAATISTTQLVDLAASVDEVRTAVGGTTDGDRAGASVERRRPRTGRRRR